MTFELLFGKVCNIFLNPSIYFAMGTEGSNVVVHSYNYAYQEQLTSGGMEDLVLSRKTSLRAALARILMKKNVQRVEDLLPAMGIDGGMFSGCIS